MGSENVLEIVGKKQYWYLFSVISEGFDFGEFVKLNPRLRLDVSLVFIYF